MQRNTQIQVAEGDVIGNWQVTGVPTRGLNGLQWKCICTAGHEKLISHSALSYSAVPTCTECQQFAIAVAIETRRYEKSVLRASSFEVTEQGRQRRISQAAQDEQQLKEGTHGETN